MKLSPHFSLQELVVTSTGLPNVPSPAEIANLRELATRVLQPWRDVVGRLKVTSGFRTEAVNLALREAGYKASRTSEHLRGLAADVKPLDTDLPDAWRALLDLPGLPIGQAILYVRRPGTGWVHVSVDLAPPLRRDLRVDLLGQPRTVPWASYRGPLVLP